MAEVLRRDAIRDAATPARPLTAPRTVHRYPRVEQARREAKSGLAPNPHMAPTPKPGGP